MKTKKSKVVITSIGVSSPIGNSIDLFFKNYENLTDNFRIEDETLESELGHFKNVNQRRMDRLTKISMMSAIPCIEGAEIKIDETTINDVGGIFCTAYGPISSARNFINTGFDLGLDSASPLIFPYTVGNAAPGAITVLMKSRGYNTTVSGYNPVAYAYDVIKKKKAKAILAGGFEELTPEIEEAYKTRTIVNEKGEKEIAPLDTISEGAAMLFVEEEDFAIKRNAKILFELCGYGVSSNLQKKEKSIDNFGYISPLIIQRSMQLALKRSDISSSKIDIIISLSRKDSKQTESEIEAIRNIWPLEKPKIHYTKKVLGETFGASAAFATIVGYLKGQKIKRNKKDKKHIMVNSFHIGGNCFSLIIAI